MSYVDTTGLQVARAAGGWAFAGSLFGFVATFQAWVSGLNVGVPAALLAITLASGALFWWSTARFRAQAAANTTAMAGPNAMEPLDSRRVVERRLVITRHALLAAFLVSGVLFIVLVSTLVCPEDQPVCTGIVAEQEQWLHVLQPLTLVFGALLVAVAFLAKAMRVETDRLEDVAADALRRRDDGPTPGLSARRWD